MMKRSQGSVSEMYPRRPAITSASLRRKVCLVLLPLCHVSVRMCKVFSTYSVGVRTVNRRVFTSSPRTRLSQPMTIVFARDKNNKDYCIVEAALRIRSRSKRLGMKDHEPMGVYKNKQGRTKFISTAMVTKLLRRAAVEVLGLSTNDPEIKLWSSHSIRVTAANLLHRQHLSDTFIMNRLRWKSDAFLCYLRNTIYAANSHTEKLSIKFSEKDMHQASYRHLAPHERIAGGVRTAKAA